MLGIRISQQRSPTAQRTGRKTAIEEMEPLCQIVLKGCTVNECLSSDSLLRDRLMHAFNNAVFGWWCLLDEANRAAWRLNDELNRVREERDLARRKISSHRKQITLVRIGDMTIDEVEL